MISIIDYNAGNIKSIQNMLKRIGVLSEITNDSAKIKHAQKLILPGVGHFDYGMENLEKTGLIETLNKKVLVDKTPILGICLGAQMLGNKSEEGEKKGLGWIDMDIVKFDKTKMDDSLKVPHMNWNEIKKQKESTLFDEMYNNPRFYFVHSFHMLPKHPTEILCTAKYGYKFTAAIEYNNIYGVQFHPEKSHKFGMKLLENFTKI